MAVGQPHRGLHIEFPERQIPGGLVAHQHGDLGNRRAEIPGTGVFVPQNAQLVLQQGVVQNVYAHGRFPFHPLFSFSLASRSRSAWESRR